MTENKTPSRDYLAEVRAAVEKLRGYAAGHETDILGAIDKVGDFIDTQTKGRFSGQIDKVQESAKDGVRHLVTPPAEGTHFASAGFGEGFDDSTEAQEEATRQAQRIDLGAQVDKLRAFAADHQENLTGLVDTIGDVVDKLTGGRYAEQVDKAQSVAKEQIVTKLQRPGTDASAASAPAASAPDTFNE